MKKLLPDEIEQKSFKIIERRIPEGVFTTKEIEIVKKIVHTTADFSLIPKIYFSPNVIDFAIALLNKDVDIFTDVMMVSAGITPKYLNDYKGKIICEIRNPDVAMLAKEKGITRAEAAVMYSIERNKNIKIFAIGNAPTALFEIIRLANQGVIKDFLVVGACVGMVGAAAAKTKLIKSGIPNITVKGNRGGSPIAATIINGLFKLKNTKGGKSYV